MDPGILRQCEEIEDISVTVRSPGCSFSWFEDGISGLANTVEVSRTRACYVLWDPRTSRRGSSFLELLMQLELSLAAPSMTGVQLGVLWAWGYSFSTPGSCLTQRQALELQMCLR